MVRLPRAAVGAAALLVAWSGTAGCIDLTRARKCVSAGAGSVCLVVDGGSVSVSASGLEPGSTIELFTPEFGWNEIPVTATGGLDGEHAFVSGSTGVERFEGVVTIRATAGDGTSLAGDMTFD